MAELVTTADVATPPVERQVAFDMARRGLLVSPAPILVSTAIWGLHGGLSSALAVGAAIGNLLLAAALVSWAARISIVALAAASLGGYVLRLALLTVLVFAIHGQPWVSWIPFAFTLLIAHLGLLLWETRFVSASLAYPGLRPRPTKGV